MSESWSWGLSTVPLLGCRCVCGAIVYKAMDTLTNPDLCSCQNCANRLNTKRSRACAGFYQGTLLTRLMKEDAIKARISAEEKYFEPILEKYFRADKKREENIDENTYD